MYARGGTWEPYETEPVETKLYASFNYGENVYFRLRSWNAREIIQPAWNKHELIVSKRFVQWRTVSRTIQAKKHMLAMYFIVYRTAKIP